MASHILLATKLTFNFISLPLICIFLVSCASSEKTYRGSQLGHEKVFYDSFEEVWRACQIALQKYPIRLNNSDEGVLETELIRGDKVFVSAHRKNRPPDSYRYKIRLRAVKGRVQGNSAIKVSVLKEAEYQPDFFSESKRLSSDGIEEKALLYRIQRELKISRLLRKS